MKKQVKNQQGADIQQVSDFSVEELRSLLKAKELERKNDPDWTPEKEREKYVENLGKLLKINNLVVGRVIGIDVDTRVRKALYKVESTRLAKGWEHKAANRSDLEFEVDEETKTMQEKYANRKAGKAPKTREEILAEIEKITEKIEKYTNTLNELKKALESAE